jgi:hypothetical protein
MSDRTAEMLSMEDEGGNRGFVEALARFGTDAEKKAARRKLTKWDREAGKPNDAA